MLTRREIDRALHHGLGSHPVGRYMRAGQVYVTPEDSVATLRKVMTDHDWGQVPVLDPRTGSLLGIVTRTDLIKLWGGAAPARRVVGRGDGRIRLPEPQLANCSRRPARPRAGWLPAVRRGRLRARSVVGAT